MNFVPYTWECLNSFILIYAHMEFFCFVFLGQEKKKEPPKARVTCQSTINLYVRGVSSSIPAAFKSREHVSPALFY